MIHDARSRAFKLATLLFSSDEPEAFLRELPKRDLITLNRKLTGEKSSSRGTAYWSLIALVDRLHTSEPTTNINPQGVFNSQLEEDSSGQIRFAGTVAPARLVAHENNTFGKLSIGPRLRKKFVPLHELNLLMRRSRVNKEIPELAEYLANKLNQAKLSDSPITQIGESRGFVDSMIKVGKRSIYVDKRLAADIQSELQIANIKPAEKKDFLSATDVNRRLERVQAADNISQVDKTLERMLSSGKALQINGISYPPEALIGKYRSGGSTGMHCDPRIVSIVQQELGLLQIIPHDKRESLVPSSELRNKLPGGNRNSKKHNDELKDYLDNLKKTSPNRILYKDELNSLTAADAIHWYRDRKGKETLFVDPRIEGFLLKNYLGLMPDHVVFLKGERLLKHPAIKLRPNPSRTRAVNELLSELWHTHQDEQTVTREGEQVRIGDVVRRLVHGRFIGIFCHQEILGALITSQLIESRAELLAAKS